MRVCTEKSIQNWQKNGFKVKRLGKHFILVRAYSIYCTSSWWKRHCPIYHLVKVGKEND